MTVTAPEPTWTFWILNLSTAAYFLSMVLPLGPKALRLRWARDGFLLLVFMIILDILGQRKAEAVAGLALIAGSVWSAVRSRRLSGRLTAAWLKRWREGGGPTVAAPFRGRWKASGCGPDAAKNHHLAARDQWFALDFSRVDGESLGSEILSPVDGVVAYVEDGHPDVRPQRYFRKPNVRSPAGNYVAIEAAGDSPVFVLLCHLQRGSVRVGVGATVRVGDVLGLCGNSGNTSRPHLHIHAQDRAKFAVGVARGLPLRFCGHGAEEWLEPGGVVQV
jgi:hypothetical protein